MPDDRLSASDAFKHDYFKNYLPSSVYTLSKCKYFYFKNIKSSI